MATFAFKFTITGEGFIHDDSIETFDQFEDKFNNGDYEEDCNDEVESAWFTGNVDVDYELTENEYAESS